MFNRRKRVSAVTKVSDRKLLVATHNEGKLTEYNDILGNGRIAFLTLSDVGITEDVPETGSTFRENAILKATAYAEQTGLLTLADDSGLEVAALGGRPGVLTARYGGPGLSMAERYTLLLQEMTEIPDSLRAAQFCCVIALAAPDGTILGMSEGVCRGKISWEPSGEAGFGYDPIFYFPEYGLTMAQLRPAEKHRISHRGRAVEAIAPLLRDVLNGRQP